MDKATLIRNDIKTRENWQNLGQYVMPAGGIHGRRGRLLMELLNEARPVLYRKGKNGYVQVIFQVPVVEPIPQESKPGPKPKQSA